MGRYFSRGRLQGQRVLAYRALSSALRRGHLCFAVAKRGSPPPDAPLLCGSMLPNSSLINIWLDTKKKRANKHMPMRIHVRRNGGALRPPEPNRGRKSPGELYRRPCPAAWCWLFAVVRCQTRDCPVFLSFPFIVKVTRSKCKRRSTVRCYSSSTVSSALKRASPSVQKKQNKKHFLAHSSE